MSAGARISLEYGEAIRLSRRTDVRSGGKTNNTETDLLQRLLRT